MKQKIPGQVLLRIDDQYGHHIIKRGSDGTGYTIEGHGERPTNKHARPAYFFPIAQEDVAAEFQKEGKTWVEEEQP